MPALLRTASLLLAAVLVVSASAGRASDWLGVPEDIAAGVRLYRVDRADLVSPAAPQSVRLLRVDPSRATIVPVTAQDDVPGLATVPDMARRHDAIAAVNAGFFAPSGDPTGLLRIDGRLLSDSRRARGAMSIHDTGSSIETLFDQVTARVRLRFRVGGRWSTVSIDSVDAPQAAGRLVLYSPGSGSTSGTSGGLEWTLQGKPLRATGPSLQGNTPIPEGGFVLSYGGSVRPASLARITAAPSIQVRESMTVASGQHLRQWTHARHIVSGAGLLVRAGRRVPEWSAERLSPAFATTRHPRTLVARSRDSALWLVTVDGRRPDRASGMTFDELQDLCERLDASDCLNLDGGGSTTMVVRSVVVNTPSDITGPRRVSDALTVRPR